MTTYRKSKLMRSVEEQQGEQLESLLPRLIRKHGYACDVAAILGVSKGTLSYWLMKLGIEYRRVAVCPGETLEIKQIIGGSDDRMEQ